MVITVEQYTTGLCPMIMEERERPSPLQGPLSYSVQMSIRYR
jgi:hypothetical protein